MPELFRPPVDLTSTVRPDSAPERRRGNPVRRSPNVATAARPTTATALA